MDNIERLRGDTYPETMTIMDGGEIVDVSGATVEMTIGFTTPKKLTATIIDGVTGKVSFPFTDTDTNTLGNFDYDVQVTYPSGEKATHVKANFEIIDDVTK